MKLAVFDWRSGRHVGRNLNMQEAMSHVWGYTIVNNLTARDLQGRHSRWLIGALENRVRAL
jgi:2-keto-4-pentenoate hydratase/2-oxohepta-3-ene-1,7-dioic acid hydratase in catechol pathway